MELFFCLDDQGGMMFNRRRQSQDQRVRRKIMELAGSRVLWMSPYSYGQFDQENADSIRADEHFLQKAEVDDCCFVEDADIEACCQIADRLTIFRWNRVYPADRVFDKKILEQGWTLKKCFDFEGNSHEKITTEVYER